MQPDFSVETSSCQGLTGNMLKGIAIFTMAIDHLTWTLFPGYDTRWWVMCLHAVGRITAPIMWYMIAEGYFHTRNRKKYALRLLGFAFVSHFAYNFYSGSPMLPFVSGSVFDQTSVMWALFLGLLALMLFDVPRQKLSNPLKNLLFICICILAFPADWSCVAVLAICCIAAYRGNFKKQMAAMMLCVVCYVVVYCIFLDVAYGILQLCVVLAVPLLSLYNGKRGKSRSMKWVFYVFYPLHLVLIGFLRLWLVRT